MMMLVVLRLMLTVLLVHLIEEVNLLRAGHGMMAGLLVERRVDPGAACPSETGADHRARVGLHLIQIAKRVQIVKRAGPVRAAERGLVRPVLRCGARGPEHALAHRIPGSINAEGQKEKEKNRKKK